MLRPGMPGKRRPREATLAEDDGVSVPRLIGRKEWVAGIHAADPLFFEGSCELLRVANKLRGLEPYHQEPVGTRTIRRVGHKGYAVHFVQTSLTQRNEGSPCSNGHREFFELHSPDGHADLILVKFQRRD